MLPGEIKSGLSIIMKKVCLAKPKHWDPLQDYIMLRLGSYHILDGIINIIFRVWRFLIRF